MRSQSDFNRQPEALFDDPHAAMLYGVKGQGAGFQLNWCPSCHWFQSRLVAAIQLCNECVASFSISECRCLLLGHHCQSWQSS